MSEPTSGHAKLDFDLLLERLAESIVDKLERRIRGLPLAARPRLLPIDEAATYLGRTKASIQHLVAQGVLKVVRWDRRVFLDLEDLDRLIEQHKL